MLLFVPNLVQDLPSAALAAVVIAASLSLVEVAGVRKLWRMRKTEFTLSIVCFLGRGVPRGDPGHLHRRRVWRC